MRVEDHNIFVNIYAFILIHALPEYFYIKKAITILYKTPPWKLVEIWKVIWENIYVNSMFVNTYMYMLSCRYALPE